MRARLSPEGSDRLIMSACLAAIRSRRCSPLPATSTGMPPGRSGRGQFGGAPLAALAPIMGRMTSSAWSSISIRARTGGKA
jgi:hypothetical protein